MSIEQAIRKSIEKASDSIGEIEYKVEHSKITSTLNRVLFTLTKSGKELFIQHDYMAGNNTFEDADKYIDENANKIMDYYELS